MNSRIVKGLLWRTLGATFRGSMAKGSKASSSTSRRSLWPFGVIFLLCCHRIFRRHKFFGRNRLWGSLRDLFEP